MNASMGLYIVELCCKLLCSPLVVDTSHSCSWRAVDTTICSGCCIAYTGLRAKRHKAHGPTQGAFDYIDLLCGQGLLSASLPPARGTLSPFTSHLSATFCRGLLGSLHRHELAGGCSAIAQALPTDPTELKRPSALHIMQVLPMHIV